MLPAEFEWHACANEEAGAQAQGKAASQWYTSAGIQKDIIAVMDRREKSLLPGCKLYTLVLFHGVSILAVSSITPASASCCQKQPSRRHRFLTVCIRALFS